ncbi:MAG: response regulator transcription factor [Steroidobacteraceae bacterium]
MAAPTSNSSTDRRVVGRSVKLPGTATRRLLIVEDEQALAKVLRRHLVDAGFDVHLVFTGAGGLKAAESKPFDLILLDVMLPDIDGLEVCRKIRHRNMYTPVIMLTAKATEVDKVLGLETGADDYLTKPFSIVELIARVNAIFRRVDALATAVATQPSMVVVKGILSIDGASREVRVRGRTVMLTHKEFDLLWHFVHNPGRVYTRAQLLDAVWGYSHEGYEHAINCHINRLRAKIEVDQAHPKFLLTAWGVGYKFVNDGLVWK